jgi:hypothetical protein
MPQELDIGFLILNDGKELRGTLKTRAALSSTTSFRMEARMDGSATKTQICSTTRQSRPRTS